MRDPADAGDVMDQNRQATFQQAKADHDYNEQELELKTNTELTREIDRLTIELHKRVVGTTGAVGGEGPAQAAPSQAGDG
jgi:uncharacterized membrane protein